MDKMYSSLPERHRTVVTRRKHPVFKLLLIGALATSNMAWGQFSPAAWYRADEASQLFSDAGTTPVVNGAQVFQWSEVGANGYNLLQATAGSRPVFSNTGTLANFNPTVTFDGANDFMQFTPGAGINVIDRANGTIVAAGYVNTLKRNGFAGFDATMDYPGLHIFSDYKLLFFTGGPGYQGTSTIAVQANKAFTSASSWQNGGGSSAAYAAATVSLDGTRSEYTGSQLNNANLSINARSFRIGGDNNYGSFSGQLNEIMVFEDRLTATQLDGVESYLAIKYGTTFANGTLDYRQADGTGVLWSVTTNAGYNNNIAGIGREATLHQKQSWSVNSTHEVLIGTTGMANTNAANAVGLTNNQFLIWGDNGLSKTPSVVMAGIPGLSHRFAAIWKVQNTSSVGTVRVAWVKNLGNLSLIQSADAVFSAADVITNMTANETTINGVVYNYADVTLTNGEFFTFAMLAQSPGGIAVLPSVWYHPDNATTSLWKDASINSLDLASVNGTTVNSGNQAHNFHSWTTDYSSTKYYMYTSDVNSVFGKWNDGGGTTTASTDYASGYYYMPLTVFGVARNTRSTGGGGLITGIDDNEGYGAEPGFGVYGGKQRFYRWGNGAAVSGDNAPINASAVYMWQPPAGSSTATGTDTLLMGLNGIYNTAQVNPRSSVAGPHLNIGTDNWSHGAFTGDIQEVIWYKDPLGYSDIQKVETYLALKYGTTLAHSYVNAAGDTVYNLNADTVYRYNIAGIGREAANGGLNQRQSNSVNTGTQVLISTSGIANTNDSNSISLTDGQFLLWGDNGLAKVPSVSVAGVTGINYRFASVWKVQNTGSVGNVRVAWPQGLTNTTLLKNTADPTFATVDVSYPMIGATIVNGIAYNYADVTLNDGDYFTFGSQLNGPGGVSLDLRVWMRADAGFAPTSWTDFSGNENHFTQTNPTRQPFTAAQSYNFNPIVDFGGSASADGRFMVVPNGKPFSANGLSGTFLTATLTRTGGTSGYRDIWGFGGTAATASLSDADAPVLTKLNNNIVLYNSTASAFSDQYPDNKLLLTDVSYTVNVAGIKYGLNGDTARTAQTRSTGNSLQANGSILGAQTQVTNGLIGEAIAYERDLTEAEKIRVRSYVAIKYGVTLPHNYVAANGTTVFWNNVANDGYNSNIAGIVRDDHGSLYQRQSNSINTGRQVLISTTSLSNSNATNTGALADQQFLVWGDNDSAKGPTVPITGIVGVNSRFAAIWKVQNTNSVGTVRIAWPKGFTNLTLIQSTDAVFTASDVATPMSGTQMVNGLEYAYTDVTLTNGQYFTFAAFLQGPGGVTAGILMWHKANDGTTASGTKNEWQDLSGNGRNVTQNDDAARQPLLVTDATYSADSKEYFFNYNPFYYFDGGDVLYRANDAYFPASNSPGAVYSVIMNGGGGTRTPYSFSENDNRPSLTRIGTNYHAYVSNLGNFNSTGYNITTLPAHIGAQSWRGSTAGVSLGINGRTFNSNTLSIAINTTSGSFNIGSQGSTPSEAQLGGMPEVFAYSIDHQNSTGNEKLRINSYLAIKYGITLINDSATATPNYLSSSSAVVWNALEAAFNNNIAGVANDFLSALDQKQSRSVNANTNGQVVLSVGDIAETNAANINSLSDGQFLLWGDNGNTVAMTEAGTTYTAFNFDGGVSNARRMKRVWKVQNTNVTETMQLYFPRTSVGTTTLTTGDACADYAIFFASDSAMTTNLVALPLGITEDSVNYIVAHAFPNGVSYFSFGKVTPLNNGNVYLPAIVEATSEYDNNCGAGAWSHYHKTGDASEKLLGVSGFTTTELNNLDVVITPEGTSYNDGTITTNLMARISQVIDSNVTPLSTGKVRIYYSMDEMNAALVPAALTSGWFKYEGSADEVLIDIYADGVFEANKAIALTPDASGIEDGVNYVEFHGISSFSSFVFLSSTENLGTILPVELLHFKAEKQGVNTYLSWETAKEKDNIGFAIERSSDARKWSEIGFVESKGQSAYSYLDEKTLIGTNFYRLKLMDVNGKFEYSQVQMVRFDNAHRLQIIPNPTSADFVVSGLRGNNKIAIANVAGKVLMVTKAEGVETQLIKVAHLPAGLYFVTIANDDGSTEVHKVVKD